MASLDITQNVTLVDKGRGHCFNCLLKGHRSRDCRSPPKCPEFKGKHHPSICKKENEEAKKEGQIETHNLDRQLSILKLHLSLR